MEPLTGIEPVNLFLTKEALYRLSYSGIRNRLTYSNRTWVIPALYRYKYLETAVLRNPPFWQLETW